MAKDKYKTMSMNGMKVRVEEMNYANGAKGVQVTVNDVNIYCREDGTFRAILAILVESTNASIEFRKWKSTDAK
jgi:hypothetical protein